MNSITNLKSLNNNFYKFLQDIFKHMLDDLPSISSSKMDYKASIDALIASRYDFGINSFLARVEALETSFRNSPGRTKRYYSKGKKSRTILTPLGEVTFERMCYQDRSTGKCFFYVDKCLKLDKY